MINALTVDVEDYFHVSAFEQCIRRDEWDCFPLRVVDNTRRILDLFDEFDAKGTFFVLGWVAEKVPELVREIDRRGHEVACHGFSHQRIYAIGPDSFRQDVTRAKSLLEDIIGSPVLGYRAPSYSITARSLWAIDILIESGFTYDSSIFPIHHDIYGIPGAERFPHEIRRESGVLREFPLTTFSLPVPGKRVEVPIAGGGYLRLLPVGLVSRALQHVNRAEQQPVVIYFHPWEIDADQPRISGACLKSRFRHYLNLGRTEGKVRRLLNSFDFKPMESVLASYAFCDEPAFADEPDCRDMRAAVQGQGREA